MLRKFYDFKDFLFKFFFIDLIAKRAVEFYPNIPEFAGVKYQHLFRVLHFLVSRHKRPCFVVPTNLMEELKRSFCFPGNIKLIK
jgi:hypothetical protein